METMTTKTQRAVWFALAAALSSGSVSPAAAGQVPGTGLVQVVQRATERYRDPAEADAAGWKSANACVSSPDEGAMGVHFIKGSILFDGKFDPEEPEALIYEVVDSRARLVGAEFIITVAEWEAAGNTAPPVILGQQTNFVGSPNRFGLPAFYELHVWAFRNNTKGTYVDFNPAVSCDGFEGPTSHVHGRR
jgi:hypothetical protein